MQLTFRVAGDKARIVPRTQGQVFLRSGNWDDYSFKTSFAVLLIDENGNELELGTIKIGYKGQEKGWTRDAMPQEFEVLPDAFFSLGQDVKYYKKIFEVLGDETRANLFGALRDIAYDENILNYAVEEKVFQDSLTRGVRLSTIKDQFKRVLRGLPELTDFHFAYIQEPGAKSASVELEFGVTASSTPSTNVHVLIGRNGVGKTTLLNNMVRTLMGEGIGDHEPRRSFYYGEFLFARKQMPANYFSSVISVSFSAFDPFIPPEDRQGNPDEPAFFYIGMKKGRMGENSADIAVPKTKTDLVNDFLTSFESCLSQNSKKERWRRAIRRLESDSNFAEMALTRLLDLEDAEAISEARHDAERMSSGHSIVLLTMTKLVDTVDEKALVMLDEPESHLHPPLLSAFTRALSDLLHDRNGVAIVATHSPVVLQEVPKSCVWKLTRFRAQGRTDRPERETFGENVGVLTREVFGLEVSKSGFHELLEHSVNQGGTFDQILNSYSGQLGTEAQAILRALIAARDTVTHSQV